MTRAFLVYTAGRAALFGLFVVLTWSVSGLLGWELRGLPLLLVALLLSSLAALFLLPGPRAQLAAALAKQRDEPDP